MAMLGLLEETKKKMQITIFAVMEKWHFPLGLKGWDTEKLPPGKRTKEQMGGTWCIYVQNTGLRIKFTEPRTEICGMKLECQLGYDHIGLADHIKNSGLD